MLIPWLIGTGCQIIYRDSGDGDDGSDSSATEALGSLADETAAGNAAGTPGGPSGSYDEQSYQDEMSATSGQGYTGAGPAGTNGGYGSPGSAPGGSGPDESATPSAPATNDFANYEAPALDPYTGRTQEEMMQHDLDANRGGALNAQGLHDALNDGSLNIGFDRGVAGKAFQGASALAGPAVGALAGLGAGLYSGSTQTPGVGFSSPDNMAAIAANYGMTPDEFDSAGKAGTLGGGRGGDDDQEDSSSSGDSPGPSAPMSAPSTSQIIADIGIGQPSMPGNTTQQPSTPTQTRRPLAEQIWWGG